MFPAFKFHSKSTTKKLKCKYNLLAVYIPVYFCGCTTVSFEKRNSKYASSSDVSYNLRLCGLGIHPDNVINCKFSLSYLNIKEMISMYNQRRCLWFQEH